MVVGRARRLPRSLNAALRKARLEQRARLLLTAGDEYEKWLTEQRKKTGKYHNTRTIYKGERYDSLGEAEYAWKLDQMEKAGTIAFWQRGTTMVLVDAPRARDRITYKPDFWIMPTTGWSYFVDYKGSRVTETAAWRIKVKLWKQKYPTEELRVAYPDGSEKVVAPRTA
jgi:hypothetical protein